MSLIEKNLNADETIIAKAETSMLGIIPKIISSLIICGFISLLFIIFAYSKSLSNFKPLLLVISTLIPTVLITLIFTVKWYLVVKTTELVVTSKKIFGKLGIIQTKIMDAPLNKINNISVEQRLFGKIFSYGTIIITTSSGNYNYLYIKNADDFRCKVMNQIDIYDNERIKKQAEEIARTMTKN